MKGLARDLSINTDLSIRGWAGGSVASVLHNKAPKFAAGGKYNNKNLPPPKKQNKIRVWDHGDK